jgi:hypothetical protein
VNSWSFTREVTGWRWHRIAENVGVENTSSRAFASFLECIDDAGRNGYRVAAAAQNLRLPFSKLL